MECASTIEKKKLIFESIARVILDRRVGMWMVQDYDHAPTIRHALYPLLASLIPLHVVIETTSSKNFISKFTCVKLEDMAIVCGPELLYNWFFIK